MEPGYPDPSDHESFYNPPELRRTPRCGCGRKLEEAGRWEPWLRCRVCEPEFFATGKEPA